MSIVRWSKESDVYVFEHVNGGYECCGCTHLPTALDMAEHLEWHQGQSHLVPPYAINTLLGIAMSTAHPDDCPCKFCTHNRGTTCDCAACQWIWQNYGDLRLESEART